MGTIRKTKGEFFYRKDGKTYKFLNQSVIENHFPNYSEPIHVEDSEVRTFSNGFLDFAALVSVDMMGQIVEELDKGAPISPANKMMNAEEFEKKWEKDFNNAYPISTAQEAGTYKYLEEEKQKEDTFYNDNISFGKEESTESNAKDELELAFLEGAYCTANRSGVKYIKEKFEQWYNSKYK